MSDRKEAALVCHKWYDASVDPILQSGIALHFQATTSTEKINSFLRRKTPHLILDDFDNSIIANSLVLNSCEQLSRNLKSLSLKSSNITEKTFIELLSFCHHLQKLDLSCCNALFMSGQLLAMNGDMQKLRSVLVNLREVNLSSIRYISDATFNRIMNICPNIQSLKLAATQITFQGGHYLPKNKSKCVSSTLLTYTNIVDFLLHQSNRITSLDFSRTAISDEALTTLVEIDGLHLEDIYLMCCKDISGEGIAALCDNQTSLKTVNLKECIDITDGCLRMISSKLLHLETLNMSKCRLLSDTSVKSLAQLTRLKNVDLSENLQITSVGLVEGLSGNKNLTHVKLNSCPSLTDSFVLALCKVNVTLVFLDLGSCFNLTDQSVVAISEHLKHLRYLRLAWCKNITDLGLLGYDKGDHGNDPHANCIKQGVCSCSKIYTSTDIFRKPTGDKNKVSLSDLESLMNSQTYSLKNLHMLRELDLSACPRLSDLSLFQVLHFKELQSLNLSMLAITDKTIETIAKYNHSIETLSLCQCGNLTDCSIELVSRSLSRLTSLDISSCDLLTNNSMLYLTLHSKRLKHLNVSFCKNISPAAVDDLENNLDLHNVQKRLLGGKS